MPTITIPKKLTRYDDSIAVPRKEYEALIELKKTQEFVPTAAQRNALVKAERNLLQRKTFSYHAVARKLDNFDRHGLINSLRHSPFSRTLRAVIHRRSQE